MLPNVILDCQDSNGGVSGGASTIDVEITGKRAMRQYMALGPQMSGTNTLGDQKEPVTAKFANLSQMPTQPPASAAHCMNR